MAGRGLTEKIFFVYDHTTLQKEEDDLKDAIVYFYPGTVKDDDQCALCGQLMGMVNFFQQTWAAKPHMYTLTRHKFVVKHVEDRYTLALGRERSVSDYCLEAQLDLLYETFTMYKGTLGDIREESVSNDVSFTEALEPIWDCFLPFSCAYGDTVRHGFLSLPTIELPKSGSDVFLQASAMLQASKRRPGVLGGAVLSSDSVLCTQLSEQLTRKFLVIKPQQTHLPCEPVLTDFPLPVGVRIINVHVPYTEYQKLFHPSRIVRNKHKNVSKFRPLSAQPEPPPYSLVKNNQNFPEVTSKRLLENLKMSPQTSVRLDAVPQVECQEIPVSIETSHLSSEHFASALKNSSHSSTAAQPKLKTSFHASNRRFSSEDEIDVKNSSSVSSIPSQTVITSADVHVDASLNNYGNQSKQEVRSDLNDTAGNHGNEMEQEVTTNSINSSGCNNANLGINMENVESNKTVSNLNMDGSVENMPDSKPVQNVSDSRLGGKVESCKNMQYSKLINSCANVPDSKFVESCENKSDSKLVESCENKSDSKLAESCENMSALKLAESCRNMSDSKLVESCENMSDSKLAESCGNMSDSKLVESSENMSDSKLVESCESKSDSKLVESCENMSDSKLVESSENMSVNDLLETFAQRTSMQILNQSMQESIIYVKDKNQDVSNSILLNVADFESEKSIKNEISRTKHDTTKTIGNSSEQETDNVTTLVENHVSVLEFSKSCDINSSDSPMQIKTGQMTDNCLVLSSNEVINNRGNSMTFMDMKTSQKLSDSNTICNSTVHMADNQEEVCPSLNDESFSQNGLKMNPKNDRTEIYASCGENALNTRANDSSHARSSADIGSPALDKICDIVSDLQTESQVESLEISETRKIGQEDKVCKTSAKVVAEFVSSSPQFEKPTENLNILQTNPIKSLHSNHGSLGTNSLDSAIYVSEDPSVSASFEESHLPMANVDQSNQADIDRANQNKMSAVFSQGFPDHTEEKETFIFSDNQVPSVLSNSTSDSSVAVPQPQRQQEVHIANSSNQRANPISQSRQGYKNLTLYIQGHSDSMLILLMEEMVRYDRDCIQALWKLALPQLGDLDFRVKELVQSETPRPAHEDYYFLRFNDFQRQVSGNVTKPVTSGEYEFCDLAIDLHEEFRKTPSLTELCVRTHYANVYAHRSVDHEVYFQSVNRHHTTPGLPFNRDPLFSLEQIAKRKLQKHHNITFM